MPLTCEKDTHPVSDLLPSRKSHARDAKWPLSCGNTNLHASWIPACPVPEERNWAGIAATNTPLTCGYITKWSYGDSNSGPLACHTHSGRRRAWPGVALCGVHLRLPWPGVAWRRLVPGRLGSQLGSQSSLAPLIFEAPATRPRWDSRQRRARIAEGPALAGDGADRTARWPTAMRLTWIPATSASARRPPGPEVRMSSPSAARHPTMASITSQRASSIPSPYPPPRWRVIEIRRTGDCTNRHDPLPSSAAQLADDRRMPM
jgi:hypothetical protein